MDNNAANRSASTPKQTMAAYLFSPTSKNFLAWGCKMPAKENVQDKLGIDVLDSTSQLPVTFIFSTQNVNTLQVHDILEDSSHEIIRPTSSPSSNSFLRWLHWFFHWYSFDSRTNILEHIQHIYEVEELDKISTCRNFRQVQKEGNRMVNRTKTMYSFKLCVAWCFF